MSTILSRISGDPFSGVAPSPWSSFQAQVDHLVEGFVHEAADPVTLSAIVAGGMAYRLGRIGILSVDIGAIGRSPVRAASLAIGLGSEVTAFEFVNRSLITLRATGQSPLQDASRLWSWSGPGGWRDGLASSLVGFGFLRGAGFLSREQNLVFQHAFQSATLVAGNNLAGILGIVPRSDGDLAEAFFHAEAMTLQFGAGMGLVHALIPGMSSWERGWDFSIQATDRRATRASPLRMDLDPVYEGPRGNFLIRPLLPQEMNDNNSAFAPLLMVKGPERKPSSDFREGKTRWGISEAGAVDLFAETVRRVVRLPVERSRFISEGIGLPLQKGEDSTRPLLLIDLLGREAGEGDRFSTLALIELRGGLAEFAPSIDPVRTAIERIEASLRAVDPVRLFGEESKFLNSRQWLEQLHLVEGLVGFHEGIGEDLRRFPWGDLVGSAFERLDLLNTEIRQKNETSLTPSFMTEQSLLLMGLISVFSLNQRFHLGLERNLPAISQMEGVLKKMDKDWSFWADRIRVYLGLPATLPFLMAKLQGNEEKIDPRLVLELALRGGFPSSHPKNADPLEHQLNSFSPKILDRSNYLLYLDSLKAGAFFGNLECIKQLALLGERDPHAFERLLDFASVKSPQYNPQIRLILMEILPYVYDSVRIDADSRRSALIQALQARSLALNSLMERFPPRLEPSLMARLIRPGVGFLAYTLDVGQVRELLRFLDQTLTLSEKSAQGPLDRERNLVKYFQDLKRESLPVGYAHHLL